MNTFNLSRLNSRLSSEYKWINLAETWDRHRWPRFGIGKLMAVAFQREQQSLVRPIDLIEQRWQGFDLCH